MPAGGGGRFSSPQPVRFDPVLICQGAPNRGLTQDLTSWLFQVIAYYEGVLPADVLESTMVDVESETGGAAGGGAASAPAAGARKVGDTYVPAKFMPATPLVREAMKHMLPRSERKPLGNFYTSIRDGFPFQKCQAAIVEAYLAAARSARLVPNIHIFYSRIFHRRPEIPPPRRSGHLPPTGCNTSGTLVPYSSPYVGAIISGLWAAVLRCFVWTGPRTSSSGAFQDSCAWRCRSIFKLNLVRSGISVSL